MAKKNKILNNDPSINLRLPKELKQKIVKEANCHGLTVSKYVRGLLDDYFNGRLFDEELEQYKNYWFVQSPEFLKLVVWMYTKKENNKRFEDVQELNGYISTIKKLEEHLERNLVIEFDKVLQDILRIKTNKSFASKDYFEFTEDYADNQFDFSLLENYISRIGPI